MRRAGLLAVIVALVCAAAAAAGGPGLKNLPISVPVVKGKVRVYAFALSAKLAAGTTISGNVPIGVHATNGNAVAKGTQAAAAVAKTGPSSWQVVVVVDARKAAGSGAATLTASIQVPPPYSTNPVSDAKDDDPCAEFKRVRDKIDSNVGAFAVMIWVMLGPTHKGHEIYVDGQLDCD